MMAYTNIGKKSSALMAEAELLEQELGLGPGLELRSWIRSGLLTGLGLLTGVGLGLGLGLGLELELGLGLGREPMDEPFALSGTKESGCPSGEGRLWRGLESTSDGAWLLESPWS